LFATWSSAHQNGGQLEEQENSNSHSKKVREVSGLEGGVDKRKPKQTETRKKLPTPQKPPEHAQKTKQKNTQEKRWNEPCKPATKSRRNTTCTHDTKAGQQTNSNDNAKTKEDKEKKGGSISQPNPNPNPNPNPLPSPNPNPNPNPLLNPNPNPPPHPKPHPRPHPHPHPNSHSNPNPNPNPNPNSNPNRTRT
jgi:hypothetical protein